ncbi:MAG TPA: S-layer homology domain-containing protein [Acidimicrobiia bacterium]|nr:S-layer homology domain-containing protein [Acidimicrobiia bacterium]
MIENAQYIIDKILGQIKGYANPGGVDHPDVLADLEAPPRATTTSAFGTPRRALAHRPEDDAARGLVGGGRVVDGLQLTELLGDRDNGRKTSPQRSDRASTASSLHMKGSRFSVRAVAGAVAVVACLLVGSVGVVPVDAASPVCEPPPPSVAVDVPAGSALASAVDWAVCHQVIPLKPALLGARFNPDSATSRGVLINALWVMEGRPGPVGTPVVFTDVRVNSAWRPAVDWASSVGVVTRPADGRFYPSSTATRGVLALWAFRAFAGGDLPAGAVPGGGFSDMGASTETATAVSWAAAAGIVGGYSDGTFRPGSTATRRVTVKMLYDAAGTPAAWEQTWAGAVVLGSAVGWWDTAGWDGTGDRVPDLSGNQNPMRVRAGGIGGPVRLGWDTPDRYLYTPGWDDMFVTTPDRAGMPTGSFEFRIDGDLTREIATNESGENFVFHQGGAGADGSLAVSFADNGTGAATVWTSPDGNTWQATRSTAGPSFRMGLGRRGVQFLADNGAGGRRVAVYQQSSARPPGDMNRPFADPAWVLVDTVTVPGPAVINNSGRPIVISSGTDRIPTVTSPFAAGWGRLRRMNLTAYTGTTPTTVFDLNSSRIPTPLTWARGGNHADSPQLCWCAQGDQAPGPAKVASFTDQAGAVWEIQNWQTGSVSSAVADRTALLFGNGARVEAGPSPFLNPGTAGLTVAVGFRSTRADIEGMLIHSYRPGTLMHDTPGWDSIQTAYLPSGPTFNIGDGAANRYAQSPAAVDGAATTTIGGYDRAAGTVTAYTGGRPGTPVSAPGDIGFGTAPFGQVFSIGADPDPALHSYGGFEWFAAAVFDRPLTPAESTAVDGYMADLARAVQVTVPAPIRFDR